MHSQQKRKSPQNLYQTKYFKYIQEEKVDITFACRSCEMYRFASPSCLH